jgi:hypothetical protein
MKLHFFEVKTGKYDSIDVTEDLAEYRLREDLRNLEARYGITLQITSVHDAETFVQKFYQTKGYIVVDLRRSQG